MTVAPNDQKEGAMMRYRVTADHVGGASLSHACTDGVYEDPADIMEIHITAPSPAAAERAGWDALKAMVRRWPTCRCRLRCRPGFDRWWNSVSVQAEADEGNH